MKKFMCSLLILILIVLSSITNVKEKNLSSNIIALIPLLFFINIVVTGCSPTSVKINGIDDFNDTIINSIKAVYKTSVYRNVRTVYFDYYLDKSITKDERSNLFTDIKNFVTSNEVIEIFIKTYDKLDMCIRFIYPNKTIYYYNSYYYSKDIETIYYDDSLNTIDNYSTWYESVELENN